METGPRDTTFKRSQGSRTSSNLLHSPAGKQAQPPRRQSFLWFTLSTVTPWWSIVLIMLALSSLAGGAWVGLQLMVNPQTLLWINRFVPDWIPIPITGLKPPQTLQQIRQEITQSGRIPGELLTLGKNISFVDNKTAVSDMLLPVVASQPNCQTACEQIVELRIYQSALTRSKSKNRSQEPYLQLVNQLAIVGPEETFVIAPLINAKASNQGSARSLPLLNLTRFDQNVPPQGTWLNLTGRWIRGDGTVAYGQVVHYNPNRFHLSVMLEWSSPANEDPTWQEVTGKELPELVVNQTIGLEPQFRVYQVKPRDFIPNPIQLEPISLLEPAFDNQTYSNALVLARSGLWSTSLQWLQSLKRKHAKNWIATAQAQLDVIQRHAEATQAQAEQSWASPSQQVLANLIDGRWERALQVFEKNAQNSLETADMLKVDAGQLRNRVDAVLKVNPTQRSAKAWGSLLIAAQQNRNAAIVWLKKQPKTTSADIAWINALTKRLEAPIVSEAEPMISAPGQIVGSVTRLNGINPAEWLKPKQNPALKLEDQQVWYRVQVAGFHDGKRWRLPGAPFGIANSTSVDTLWKALGLLSDPPLQLIFWLPDGQQATVYANIKAVRMQSGGIQLLAAGEKPGTTATNDRPRPLAMTDSALQWLNPEAFSLADLVQQQPEWATKAVPILAQELKQELPAGATTWEDLNQLGVGSWSVQAVPLTNNSQPDIVLTVYPEALSSLRAASNAKSGKGSSRSRTMIFSAAGQLLYSEFSTNPTLTFLAIADLGDGGTSALVVDGPSNYDLLRWSAKRQRFE